MKISNYISAPFPVWNDKLVTFLIEYKWDTSLMNVFYNRDNYSINGCVLNDSSKKETTYPINTNINNIQLAFPSPFLNEFYNEHGLVMADISVSLEDKLSKINRAIDILCKNKSLQPTIYKLIRSIQIIESEDQETDISYSHPDIPFSIFVSLCDENSVISDLRVAESILHETMHLMLTLIEDQYSLINQNSRETYYSPWREEQRPLRGVLHGLFVFRAIKDFYSSLVLNISQSAPEYKFLDLRICEIEDQILLLKKFPESTGLTELGSKLSSALL